MVLEKQRMKGLLKILVPCNLASSDLASTVYTVKLSVVICE